ncbi:hypothetical protein BpHYR1_048450, partial [Brachionus plicatilis]
NLGGENNPPESYNFLFYFSVLNFRENNNFFCCLSANTNSNKKKSEITHSIEKTSIRGNDFASNIELLGFTNFYNHIAVTSNLDLPINKLLNYELFYIIIDCLVKQY